MTTETMTLTAFLLARIAEDEAVAQSASLDGSKWQTTAVFGPIVAIDNGTDFGGEAVAYDEGRPSESQAAHIALHDPARVLAECEAKRRIMEEHRMVTFTDITLGFVDVEVCAVCHGLYVGPPDDEDWLDDHEPVNLQQPFPCRTLRLLTLPYADHPDYRQTWRP